MSKADIARKAAISYFGLSQSKDGFPRGTKIEIFENFQGESANDDFINELDSFLKKKWFDNIGSLSKVARISAHDLCAYANALRQNKNLPTLSPSSPEIELIMKKLISLNPSLTLVKITHTKDTKYLLVNSEVSV
ncbi:MAG: hypothetical protein QXT63_04565 [Thermoplasmata archaeon]